MHHRLLRCLPLLLPLILGLSAAASAANFTVGQEDGRWWLFDPDGERFFSTGINVGTPDGYYCPDLGYAPYHVNIMNLYGSEEAWAETAADRLESWNFNTLGGWCDNGLLGDRLYYTTILYMSGADWLSGFVPDYWSDEFYENVEEKAATCANYLGDERLIGYFLDNEMRWGFDWRRQADLFSDYIALPPDSPGKRVLVQFFRERYADNIVEFKAVHGLDIRGWDDLLYLREVVPIPLTKEQADDREAWLAEVAEQFFAVTTEAVRAVDPDHLILGSRFVSWLTPRVVAEAAARYVDVMSINHYMVWQPWQWLAYNLSDDLRFVSPEDMLANYNELSDLPILISEFSFRGLDAVPPSTFPPAWVFMTAADQTQRTEWMSDYTHQCTHSDYIVGYHWFAYVDEPELGRFDGEDSNFGLVDEQDAPYEQLVAAFTAINAEVYNWPFTD